MNNIIKYNIVIALVSLAFFSCKKAEERNCFKTAGEETSLIINLENSFDSLELYGNIIYNLIPDTLNKVVLEGGENLLPHIDVDYISPKRYKVSNENKCNFLRSYKKKVTANIHFKELGFIYFEGSENLTTLDTLKSSEFRMKIRDGAGSVNLLVENGYTSVVVTHGFGDFTIAGSSLITFLQCRTNSFCDARNLKTQNYIRAMSETQGEMKINADNTKLEAVINRGGNILYQGEPTDIELEKEGEGNLINID